MATPYTLTIPGSRPEGEKDASFRNRVLYNLGRYHAEATCPIKNPHLNFLSRDCKFCNFTNGYCFYPCKRRWESGFNPIGIFIPVSMPDSEANMFANDTSSLAEFIPAYNEYAFAKCLTDMYKNSKGQVCTIFQVSM